MQYSPLSFFKILPIGVLADALICTLIFTFVSALASTTAHAMPRGMTYRIEPIVGYERVQKFHPVAHFRNRLLLGGRLIGGYRFLSLEAEYTRSADSRSFAETGSSFEELDQKLKLGLRSEYSVSQRLSAYLRAGGEARQSDRIETKGTTVTRDLRPIEYNPYAGLGMDVRLGRVFSLNAGVTAVFNEFPDMAKNDYQTTLGFSLRIP